MSIIEVKRVSDDIQKIRALTARRHEIAHEIKKLPADGNTITRRQDAISKKLDENVRQRNHLIERYKSGELISNDEFNAAYKNITGQFYQLIDLDIEQTQADFKLFGKWDELKREDWHTRYLILTYTIDCLDAIANDPSAAEGFIRRHDGNELLPEDAIACRNKYLAEREAMLREKLIELDNAQDKYRCEIINSPNDDENSTITMLTKLTN